MAASETQRRVVPSGEHVGCHISSMTANRRAPFLEICLVGRALHLDAMRHFVALFREGGS